MHILQEKLLELSSKHNLGEMSLRQIAKLVEEEYPETIRHHLTQLEKKGLIKIDRERNRIEKIGTGEISDRGLLAIPILGSANAGSATIFADANIEGYLQVSPKILDTRHKVFAVRVSGSSMNKASIKGDAPENGDYVIVDSEETVPENGQYVLSTIDGVANIKKFFKDDSKQQIILTSESTMDYAPIYIHPEDAESYLVNGRVIKVIKQPKM